MNSPENPLVIRASAAEDGPEIVTFLRENSKRTPNVFERNEGLVLAQAAAGRITTVRQRQDPRLIAMSSVYIMGEHAPGDPTPPPKINCIDHGSGRRPEKGSVAELGSVIRDLDPARQNELPKGFGRLVGFGMPIFMGLMFPTEFELFVTEVFHSNPETKIFVQDGRVVINKDNMGPPKRYEQGSPINCEHIARIHKDLLVACGATGADSDQKAVESGRDFFRITIQNVVPLAETFRRILDTGYLEDLRSPRHIKFDPDKKLYMDLSEMNFWGTPLNQLVDFILTPRHRTHFENADPYGMWSAEAKYTSLRIPQPTSAPARGIPAVNGVAVARYGYPAGGLEERRLVAGGG